MKFVSNQRLATNTAASANNLQTRMARKTHLNHQTGRSKVNSLGNARGQEIEEQI